MLPERIELLLRSEVNANQTLDWLLDRLINEEHPDQAREALRQLADQYSDDQPQSLEALIHYRGMRNALSSEDFLFLKSQKAGRKAVRKFRRERLAIYQHYLQLFELNMKIARSMRRSTMALNTDWSGLGADVTEDLHVMGYRIGLRLAGFLFRWNLPNSLHYCDAAVFEMFRVLYLRAA